jgi:hypothetical protein
MNVAGAAHDLYVRRKYVYLRHGIPEFLEALKPHYNLFIYTSVMLHNVIAVLDLIPNRTDYIVQVFDRQYNKPDPNANEAWETIRDINKIIRYCKNLDNSFSLASVILLDNETRKFQECFENGILVPEYGIHQVQSKEKNTLVPIQQYLVNLGKQFAEGKFDVRDFMKKSPLGLMLKNSDKNKAQASVDELAVFLGKVKMTETPAKDLFKKHAGDTTFFERLDGQKVTYMGFNGLMVKFVTKKGLCVTRKMNFSNLWKAIDGDSSPDVSVTWPVQN